MVRHDIAAVLDRIPETIGRLTASLRCWTPLRKEIEIQLEQSEDAQLIGKRLAGTVCAYDADLDGGVLLVQLGEPLVYVYGSATFSPEIVSVSPALRGHGPKRLLITWCAVELFDAPSFVDLRQARTIATGRLSLSEA